MLEQQTIDSINETLDRIEELMDGMQYKLDRIVEELGIGEEKEENVSEENKTNKPRNDIYTQLSNHKNTTLTYDVNVKYKQ